MLNKTSGKKINRYLLKKSKNVLLIKIKEINLIRLNYTFKLNNNHSAKRSVKKRPTIRDTSSALSNHIIPAHDTAIDDRVHVLAPRDSSVGARPGLLEPAQHAAVLAPLFQLDHLHLLVVVHARGTQTLPRLHQRGRHGRRGAREKRSRSAALCRSRALATARSCRQ